MAARNQLLGLAAQSKVLTQVRPDGLEDAPQLQLDIDRDKAQALGVGFDAINAVLSTALGSTYVNDFPNARPPAARDGAGRCAGAHAAGRPAAAQRAQQPGQAGAAVGLRHHALDHRPDADDPLQRLPGDAHLRRAAPGYSTGAAMDEMERLAAQLPPGFGFEWTGQSREEKLAGAQALILYGFAILAVFLCLAALYESWSIPLAVMLVVPLGVLGVLLATLLRGYANDVYFKVGLITIIGLSAKNAILIIEFAKDLQAQGKSVIEAALEAAHLRFRPIVMTSMAFVLGVLPLAIASGAGSASQRAIGTGVMGGMITGTALAVFFVPVFFVVVRRIFKGSERQRKLYAHELGGRRTAGRRHARETRYEAASHPARCWRRWPRPCSPAARFMPDLRAAGRAGGGQPSPTPPRAEGTAAPRAGLAALLRRRAAARADRHRRWRTTATCAWRC